MDWVKNMVYQNDKRVPKNFQLYGCYVRSLLSIAEFASMQALTADQINDILARGFKAKNVFRNEYFWCGPNESWLINEAFKALKNDRQGKQVGYSKGEECANPWEYCLLQWDCITDNPDAKEHYTLGGRSRVELFDPYLPSKSYAPKKDKVVFYRYYRTWPV